MKCISCQGEWTPPKNISLSKCPFCQADILQMLNKQAVLHIGDGKCVTVNANGEYSQPIPWDEKCFLNQTTSLCDEQALTRFRYYFSKENLPIAIFIASDGVDDTFGTEEALHGFYKTVLQLFSEKGMSDGVAELQTYLPQLSAKGSQDDISIAGILRRKELLKLR